MEGGDYFWGGDEAGLLFEERHKSEALSLKLLIARAARLAGHFLKSVLPIQVPFTVERR